MSAIRMKKRQQVNFRNSGYFAKPQQAIRRMEITRRYRERGKAKKQPMFSTHVTSRIKDFAKTFPGTPQGILNMILRLKEQIKFVREKPSVAEAHYMRQTADDIMATGKIPVPFTRLGSAAYGCNALCIVVAACLRAKKIPYKFVRTIERWQTGLEGNSHSAVTFRLGKKWFITDPFRKKDILQQIGQTLSEQIRQLKESKKWVEAASPEELGINSYDDYDRHNPR